MTRFAGARRVNPGMALIVPFLWWLFAGIAPALAVTTSLVTINTRPGVTQKFILIKPDQPIASVILFSGLNGVLSLSQDAGGNPMVGNAADGFLVRTRQDFANRGFMVAVVDAPSDHQDSNGMFGGFRASAEHALDIAAVVTYLRSRAILPVWLIGTSRGTESAANNAIRVTQGIGGVVLTSSTSVPNLGGPTVLEMNLNAIRVPAFVLHHDQDQCSTTPPAGAPRIAAALKTAPAVALTFLAGGTPSTSDPCGGGSHHAFYGVETNALDAIDAFVRANSPYSITGAASGPLTSRALVVTVQPALVDLGTIRQIFVAALLGPCCYFLTPAGWQLWSSGSLPIYGSGVFTAAQTIRVLDGNLDLTGAAGAQIYVGYGIDDTEMVASGRYTLVHTVQ